MNAFEFLNGSEKIELGCGVKIFKNAISLYQAELSQWPGEAWMKAAQSFIDAEDPPRRFPSIGQCKAALRMTAGAVREGKQADGCGVCSHTGWAQVLDHRADDFYGLPHGTIKAAARCRCPQGMARSAGFTRQDGAYVAINQIQPEAYSEAVRDEAETPLRTNTEDVQWIEQTGADGVITVSPGPSP